MARRFFSWLSLSGGPIKGRVLDYRLSELTADDLPRPELLVPGTYYGPFTIHPNGTITSAAGTTPPTPSGMPSQVFNHTLQAASVGSAETDLFTDTLAAGLLGSTNDRLEIVYHGTFNGGVSNQTIAWYFDGTMLFQQIVGTVAVDMPWTLRVSVIRTAATTVRLGYDFHVQADVKGTSPTTTLTATVTLSGAVAVKITGTGTSDGDVTAELGYATKYPA